MRNSLIIPAALLVLAACSKEKKPAEGQQEWQDPGAAKTAAAPQAAPPSAPGSGTGTVVETMDSGGYTYALLDTGSEKVWTAGPQTPLAVGEQVSYAGATTMQAFHSNTLDRTFDVIHFVTAYQRAGQAAGGAPTAANPHGQAAAPAAETGPAEKIAPPAGGTSIADVFARKAELAGKEVTVRGKVVKYNAGIMGKNWLHLRDGSGEAGAADLTITTDATASMGEVVTARGILAVNKDFGAGYAYDGIIENAALSRD